MLLQLVRIETPLEALLPNKPKASLKAPAQPSPDQRSNSRAVSSFAVLRLIVPPHPTHIRGGSGSGRVRRDRVPLT